MSGTLTSALGGTAKAINVTVYGDMLVEDNEVFAVNLSNAVGAAILDGQGPAQSSTMMSPCHHLRPLRRRPSPSAT